MNNTAFAQLRAAIESGVLTPDQMEDVVMALDAAYRAHHKHLYQHMSCDLRDVSDEMTMGRENVEAIGLEEEAADMAHLHRGHVRTVPNVHGASLELAA